MTTPHPTASRFTRLLGAATVLGFIWLVLLAFVFTDPDRRVDEETGVIVGQFDAVRLLYVHLPVAILTYLACSLTAVASAIYLRNKSRWWDTVAHASAEIGVLFCGLTLVTGSIWGRPIWNTWWEWGDVRQMTTLVLFLIYLGYLALRSLPGDPDVRARRAAIVALIAVPNLIIVNRSVEWWENRTLHQKSTLADFKFEDLTLFATMFGILVFVMAALWMLVHRFRIGWLEHEHDSRRLELALAERRAEARVGVEAAIGQEQ